MITIFQRDISEDNGECLRACVASLFEVCIDDVPHFCRKSNPNWLDELQAWALKQNMGVLYCLSRDKELNLPSVHSMPYGYCIMGGPSCSGNMHAVVGFGDQDGFKIVFDPHPDKVGLLSVEDIIMFTVLDPARPLRPLKSEVGSALRKLMEAAYGRE